MRLFKAGYKDKDGKKRKSAKWYLDFSDNQQRRKKLPAFESKRASESLSRNVENLISCRASGQGIDKEMQRWIENLPERIVKKLVSFGLLDSQRAEGGRVLTNHLQDWKQSILVNSESKRQAEQQYYRAKRVFDICGFKSFSDIRASKLQSEISKLKDPHKRKTKNSNLSNITKNYYLKACKQFCRWAVMDGRINENPLKHLKPLKAQSQKRAALGPDEIRRLLETTRQAGRSFGLEGYQRAGLYLFACETGFRASEIRALRACDIDFNSGTVKLSGEHTKNGQDAEMPLRKNTAEMLKGFIRNKAPNAKVFKIPSHPAEMFRKDLSLAGVEIDQSRGKVDFHSLRHTFGTLLADSGVHPKTAMDLMRHGDINLTMSRYTHTIRGQAGKAINTLPDFSLSSSEKQKNQKTGTDDSSSETDQIYLDTHLDTQCAEQRNSTNFNGRKEGKAILAKTPLNPAKQGSKPEITKSGRWESNPHSRLGRPDTKNAKPLSNKALTKVSKSHLDTSLDSQAHQTAKNSNPETTRKKLIQRINQQLEKADIQTVKKVLKTLESEG